MVKTSAIKPLSDFLRNSKSHIQHLHTTCEPEILTVNGEAAVVVQDAASYEKMAALADQAIQDARLQSAMNYFREGGKGISSENVFASLEEKYLTS
jgi:anti-sigma factor ChrR (cupin superfamily)